jgi:hypothetical protein
MLSKNIYFLPEIHSNLFLGSLVIKDVISFESNSEPALVTEDQAFMKLQTVIPTYTTHLYHGL